MRSFTLKNIPDEVLSMAEASAKANYRSVNQELICRLQGSLEADAAAVTRLHQQWIDEALKLGQPEPYREEELDELLEAGIKLAAKRKLAKRNAA